MKLRDEAAMDKTEGKTRLYILNFKIMQNEGSPAMSRV